MIQDLFITASDSTPEINLKNSGVLSISGESYPENTFEFYTPMLEWVKNYFNETPAEKTIVNMELIYFNSSSSKVFFDFLDLFDENKEKHTIEINWIYDKENETAQEAGEDLVDDFEGLSINMQEKTSL